MMGTIYFISTFTVDNITYFGNDNDDDEDDDVTYNIYFAFA